MLMLLEYREGIIRLFRRFENYIRPAARFIILLVIMLELQSSTGYSETLSGMLPALIVALLGALIPVNYTAAIILIITALQLYSLSLETGAVMGGLVLLIFLAYLRFSPKDTWLMLLMPLFYKVGIPYVLAFAGGLLFTPFSAVSCALGLLTAGFVSFADRNSEQIAASSSSEVIDRFRFAIEGIADDKSILLLCISMAGIIAVVWIIRRLQIRMAWTVAIGVGAVAGLLIILAGDMRMDTGISIGGAFLGMIVSIVIALGIQFMMFNLDYSGIENVQFEDDSYYYYVKAVPKVSVAAPVHTVKKINASRGTAERKQPSKAARGGRPVPVYDDTESLYMQDDDPGIYDDADSFGDDYYGDDDLNGGNWN